MKKKKTGFDRHQGHGDHLDSIMDSITFEELVSTLPDLLQKSEVIAATDGEIPCSLSKDHPEAMRFFLLQDSPDSLHLTMLLGFNKPAGNSELIAFYPEYDGASVAITLTKILEWGNGVEATLVGTFDKDRRDISLFDTRYAINKGKYVLGETYNFRLAAIAFRAEVIQQRTIQFEGDEAVQQCERFGDEQEYDENGNPKPFIIDTTPLVALFQSSEAYPHTGEFRSPIFGLASAKTFSGNFHVLNIGIARTEDDEVVVVPLVAKQSFFPDNLQKGEPVQGTLWLQGYQQD